MPRFKDKACLCCYWQQEWPVIWKWTLLCEIFGKVPLYKSLSKGLYVISFFFFKHTIWIYSNSSYLRQQGNLKIHVTSAFIHLKAIENTSTYSMQNTILKPGRQRKLSKGLYIYIYLYLYLHIYIYINTYNFVSLCVVNRLSDGRKHRGS